MPADSPSRPTMPGGLRPPAPQAAVPGRGHEPPDPYGTGTGTDRGLGPSPERASGEPRCPIQPGRKPLPDPVAVRLCLIPDPAPPYDAGKEQPVVAGERPDQGRAPGPRAAVSREHTGQPDDAPEHGGPQGGGQAAGTAPESPAWPSRFAQVLAETLAGSRPPYQMVPWTTEMARAHIGRLGPQLASSQQPRVRRVVTFHPTRDAIEMTVVAAFGPRVHALAVRMERDTTHACHPPRWLCTAIEAA